MIMQECKYTGNFNAVITSIDFIQNRFHKEGKENEVDVKIGFKTIIDNIKQEGFSYLSLSGNTIQVGKYQGRTSKDVSLDTMQSIGLANKELGNIKTLVGKDVGVFGKVGGDQEQYLNFFINAPRIPDTIIDPSQINALLGIGTATKPQVTSKPVAKTEPTIEPEVMDSENDEDLPF
jgi:hypothetical protein